MIRDELKLTVYIAAILLALVTIVFVIQGNYEFLMYVAVLLGLGGLIVFTDNKVHYPRWLVWLLFGWGILHMAGGAVVINGEVLYAFMLYEIIGEPYLIFKYDQIVHMYGFFVATVLSYYLLRGHLKKNTSGFALGLIIFCAGLGLSAINEIIEFAATVFIPDTNVGGYVNTALDLCFNALGAGLAIVWLKFKKLL